MTGSIAGFAGYALSMLYVPSVRMAIFFSFLATFLYCAGVIAYAVRHRGALQAA